MSAYQDALAKLRLHPRRWLLTGVAGFIGSNLLETLLGAGQEVVGLDNLTTGRRANWQEVLDALPADAAKRFSFVEGDIRSPGSCEEACRGIDIVLHQAAQVSVPASMTDPATTVAINVGGFRNVCQAAIKAGTHRIVYASSCAIYGDTAILPLTEDQPARPLSPYAESKLTNEREAAALPVTAGLQTVGLRYFNVFGPRQDPRGAYAAVIPQWTAAMIHCEPIRIYGDGSTTRDFCHVSNVVQANVLAATAALGSRNHEVMNVACGVRTSLNELFQQLRSLLVGHFPYLKDTSPVYEPFRAGDIRHSHASIKKAQDQFGFAPTVSVADGLRETVEWFRR